MSAIRLDNLRKHYRTGFWMRQFEAVKGVSLTVEQGESFGFVGPNGAGKTSTIKVLAGLQSATSGDAFINGISCSDPRSREHLGFLPERPYFYTHLTAKEVLRLYGALFGMKGQVLTDRIQSLLARVEMTQFADVALGKYSKGMLQRVGLCQTLLHDPDVILLDEPMSGLDPVGRAMVRDIILEEKQAGRTVFFCSHVLSDVETICQRVAILVKGEIRSMGAIADLVTAADSRMVCTFQMVEDYPVESLNLPTEQQPTAKADLWTLVLAKSDFALFLRDNVQKITIVDVHQERKSLEDLFVDMVLEKSPHTSSNTNTLGVLA